jgi:hypothetical protein
VCPCEQLLLPGEYVAVGVKHVKMFRNETDPSTAKIDFNYIYINAIYETGEWPKDFTEVTMITLKKKPQATKCSDHRTVSLITHTAKILRRIEKKIENVLGEDRFEFRRGKGTRDLIGC